MRAIRAILTLVAGMALWGCEPEPKPIPNPFDRLKDSVVVFNDTFMSGTTIQALHSRLCRPAPIVAVMMGTLSLTFGRLKVPTTVWWGNL